MKSPRAFLHIAGAPRVDDGPLPTAVANGVRRAQGSRVPGEARPALEPIRQAAVPSLVASGDHTPGIERICDALAVALDAQRFVASGTGHFVAEAAGFAERFEQFLLDEGRPCLNRPTRGTPYIPRKFGFGDRRIIRRRDAPGVDRRQLEGSKRLPD